MVNAPTSGRNPGLPGFAGRGAALWAALALAGALRIALWLHRTGPVWFEEKVPLAWALRLWGFDRGGFHAATLTARRRRVCARHADGVEVAVVDQEARRVGNPADD